MNRRWLAVLGAIAALAACRSTPESLSVTLSDASGTFGTAVQVAERVHDPVQRAEVLSIVARGYLLARNPDDALRVAREAARLVDDTPLSADIVPLQMATAELLLAAGDTAKARALIVEATAFLDGLRDEATRASLLPVVIRTAILGDDETRDLLPAAVDPVYIIEDTGLRAEAFIQIADAYLDGELAQSVGGLIQQAIPATRSEPDAQRRARLFGELSTMASRGGESALSATLAEDAEEELQKGIASAAPAMESVTSVYRVVAKERGGRYAIESAPLLLSGEALATAYLAIASGAREDASARLALERATEVAGSLDEPEAAGAIFASIADEYVALNLGLRARANAERAAALVWAQNADPIDVVVHQRLARVFALLDLTGELRDHLGRITEPFVRGMVSVTAATVLVETGSLGTAEDFLVDALLAAEDSGFLADRLREDAAEGFGRAGNFQLVIRTIERIEDPASRARAVATLSLHAAERGGLDAEQLADLNRVLQIGG